MSLDGSGPAAPRDASLVGCAPDAWGTEAHDDAVETAAVLASHAETAFPEALRQPIVRHVMRTACPEPDFSIRLAAVHALIRRRAYVDHDALRIVSRPPGRALGSWVVEQAAGERHEVLVESLDPIRTSCGCRDFLRSSLGVCKHGLAALVMIRRRAWGTVQARAIERPTLAWDPIERVRGSADRLARLWVVGGAVRIDGMRAGAPKAERLSTPCSRLALVRTLMRAIDDGVVDAQPAALAILAEEAVNADRLDTAERTRDAAERTLGTLRRCLYPYQRQGVRRFLATGRLLLGDDMGLGKTTQAASAAHALFHTGQIARGLLIVPASLKPQWRREWIATTDVPITVVDGPPEERARIYRAAGAGRGFLVIGYEQLLRDLELVRRFDPELVILDEAQRIKNRETKSAIFVKSLSPRFRLALTGTPMENRLGELSSIVDFVDDTALMPSWRLAPFHTFEDGDGDDGISGARNLGLLRARLAPVMLRRIRKEVLAQLPERTDTTVPVPMTGAQIVEHATRETAIAALLRIASRRGLTRQEHERLMKLFTEQRIICNGIAQLDFDAAWERCEGRAATPKLLDSLDSPKLSALRPLVRELCITQGRKVVVFSAWRRMLRLAEWAVRDVLAEAGLRAAFFTGAESPKLRERAIVDFHDDPSLALLFLTDAGGVGLNLQRAASACIQLELPWNPAVMEQRIGRIYRIGQSRPIDAFQLVSEGGIESRIAAVIGHKRALFTGLFDGTSDEIRFDGRTSFVEALRTVMEPASGEPDVVADPAPEGPATLMAELPPPIASPPPAVLVPSEPPPPRPAIATPEPVPAIAPFQIHRRADGGLSIDVPPAHAAPLAGLLASLAEALRGA